MDLVYMILIICLFPTLCALSLGGFGNNALRAISSASNKIINYLLIILILLTNTYFIIKFLSYDVAVFGLEVDIKYVHLFLVTISLVLIYSRHIFGNKQQNAFQEQ